MGTNCEYVYNDSTAIVKMNYVAASQALRE